MTKHRKYNIPSNKELQNAELRTKRRKIIARNQRQNLKTILKERFVAMIESLRRKYNPELPFEESLETIDLKSNHPFPHDVGQRLAALAKEGYPEKELPAAYNRLHQRVREILKETDATCLTGKIIEYAGVLLTAFASHLGVENAAFKTRALCDIQAIFMTSAPSLGRQRRDYLIYYATHALAPDTLKEQHYLDVLTYLSGLENSLEKKGYIAYDLNKRHEVALACLTREEANRRDVPDTLTLASSAVPFCSHGWLAERITNYLKSLERPLTDAEQQSLVAWAEEASRERIQNRSEPEQKVLAEHTKLLPLLEKEAILNWITRMRGDGRFLFADPNKDHKYSPFVVLLREMFAVACRQSGQNAPICAGQDIAAGFVGGELMVVFGVATQKGGTAPLISRHPAGKLESLAEVRNRLTANSILPNNEQALLSQLAGITQLVQP